jgi:murein DD-endopeptidase MepM/ murein hydrolase activator NlpD
MKVNIRIGRNKTSSLVYAFFVLVSLLALILALGLFQKKGQKVKEKAFAPPASPAKVETPPLKEQKEIIHKGFTLADILAKCHFSPAEIHQLREEIKPVYDLAKIKAGHEIRFFTSSDGQFQGLEYDIDETSYLVVQKDGSQFRAEKKEYPFEIKEAFQGGIIEDNLISAFNKLGEKDALAFSLADLFGWDIDFYTDLRRGDSFVLLFEKKFLNGKFFGYGNILAAEFRNQGKVFQAFHYAYPDNKKSDHFDAEGNSLRKEFLKSPIKFAHITSRFSFSRLHPIHKVYRPHYGVDYAASIGFPVQATADGTVTFAGWNGASGRMITIRHQNAYETMYLHLKNYAPGIKVGAKVKGGDVIGYVGSSGESTGPHLDYRIQYHGSYINPLGWKFKPVEPLRKEFLEDYKKEVEKYKLGLEAPLIFMLNLFNSF